MASLVVTTANYDVAATVVKSCAKQHVYACAVLATACDRLTCVGISPAKVDLKAFEVIAQYGVYCARHRIRSIDC